jgi:two-component sensor histidine kinase
LFRLGLVIALFFVIGAAVSGLAALRIHEQDKHIEQAAFDRAVETHAGSVQERLSERELLAEVSVALFRPPPVPQIRALDPLRDAIRAFRADFYAISWIRTLQPAEIEQALEILRSEGASGFQSRAPANAPPPVGQPHVILDIEPRDPVTVRGLGVDVRTVPQFAKAIEAASRTNRPAATDPVRVGGDGPYGVALIAPAFGAGNTTPTGYISFSFGFGSWLLSSSSSAFIAALKDPRQGMPGELSVDSSGEIVTSAPLTLPSTVKTVNFGGREWEFAYYRRQDPTQRIFWAATSAFLVGLALTSVVCGLFGYVAYNNLRLSREIESRVSFEHRLAAVIGELNHRVKNLLAVIQSIVTRTLRPGADLNSARDLLIGRIHAMSHVVSLLSESEWQGARLKGLLESRAIPNSERMVATGPDITVSARAAQSLSLLFFELANHASDTVLADPDRFNVVVQWTVSGEAPNAVFHLRWEEFNTSSATRREETEFGAVLLDRVAPEAVGGKSQRYFTDASYVYELTAPLEAVIDRTERERTDRMARLADQHLH